MNTQQRTAEWHNLDDSARQYHLAQWRQEKQSTRAFADFISGELSNSRIVVDLGCGAGACTNYLATRNPSVQFSGVDLSGELIQLATDFGKSTQNLSFSQGDWFALPPNFYDGAVSLQTLSWLPEFETPLEQIFSNIKPKWFAATSLFYEGDISCRIEVTEHARERTSFYNVYSLPALARFCERHDYRLTRVEPFNIGIDLAKPSNLDAMGTYTRKTDDGSRLQISGPLLMPWHMILIERQLVATP